MGNQFLQAVVETAIEAGGILLSEFDRPAKVSQKGKLDLVTEADRHSEQAIVSRLRRCFPKHAILSEEGGGQDGDARCRWIVDPLDGTTNFVHRYPCFAVSIAFEQAGELLYIRA
jgi:myo-inositol-1(or 4)-monophosphatase